MKAEDTVTYTLTCNACGNSYYSKEAFPKHQHCKTCTLAFQAGYIQGVEDTGNKLEQFLLKWKQAGIKEVVEWIEHQDNPVNISHIHIVRNDWQSKLKEWGL